MQSTFRKPEFLPRSIKKQRVWFVRT